MSIGKTTECIGAALIAIALGTTTGHAQGPQPKTATPAEQGAAEPALRETATPVFQHDIPNVDGRALIAVVVTYPPGGKSAAHRHAPSAFIYAHVLSGAVRSQVDNGPAKIYRAGEGFYEDPGAHHRISENASATEPASMLAVFIVDPKEHPLTVPDQK